MMKKRVDFDTFMNMEIPVTLSVSRDGKQAYVEFKSAGQEDYRSVIKSLDLEKEILSEVCSGFEPVISPDGEKLLYLKAGEGGMQELRLLDRKSGQERTLGQYRRMMELSWSEDGEKVLFTAAFPLPHEPEDLLTLESVQWIDRVKFKTDGVGLFDGTYRQIGVLDLKKESLTLISEVRRDLSEPRFVGNETVAYLGIPKEPDNSDDFHLYVRALHEKESKIFPGPGGPMGHLAVSPDKRYLAFIGHDNRYWEATNFKLYVFDLEEETFRCLTEAFDRSVGNYVINDTGYDRNRFSLEWEETGERIYTLITDGYAANLYLVEVKGGAVKQVTDEKCVWFMAKKVGKEFLAFGSEEGADGRIVRINDEGLIHPVWQGNINDENYELSHSKEFTFLGYDASVRKALYYPPTAKIKGMILNIHGGPHYCHGYDLSFDIQLLTSKGYGVVICNPAGSQGSGEALARASYHDWGGKDYRELLSCVEAAKQEFSLSDLPWAVMGGSYGGFMTNWMISHTDCFVCAISERSTCNRYSQAGTSDCAFRYGMFEFDGKAWENPKHYMEHSPITYVKDVHTPVLLIHGDQDMNCPISQSEEWYSALKMEGKEAYLAVFPGQYHSLTGKGSPESRRDRYRLIIWWLDRFMDQETRDVTGKESGNV